MQRITDLIEANAKSIRSKCKEYEYLSEQIKNQKTDWELGIGSINHAWVISRYYEKQAEHIEEMKRAIKILQKYIGVLETKLNELEPFVKAESERYWIEE